MKVIDFNVYIITDRKLVSPDSFFYCIEEALKAGGRAIQLREKDLTVRELTDLAVKARELTDRYSARLFINDRIDVAMAVEADGVHLGSNSISVSTVKRFAKGLIVGVSTHSLKEAEDAAAGGADFITFGPVFETRSKLKYGKPVGTERLDEVVRNIDIPVFALGGVNSERLNDIKKAGAYGVAMISAVFASDDVNESTKKIVRMMK